MESAPSVPAAFNRPRRVTGESPVSGSVSEPFKRLFRQVMCAPRQINAVNGIP
jgi:hypothetical protein